MQPTELASLLQLESNMVTDAPAIFKLETGKMDMSMVPKHQGINKIEIFPLKVATVEKITPILVKLKQSDLDKITVSSERDFEPEAPEIFSAHMQDIIEIICLGVHNKKGPYPEYYPEFLKENFTWKELHVLLNAITFRMGYLSFLKSTAEVMKAGPGTMEIIAMEENLQEIRKSQNSLAHMEG